MSGKVTVNGTTVTISLSDQTTGESVTKSLQMSQPDTSSAEWIAEAPGGSRGRFNLAQFANIEFAADKAWAGSTVYLAQTWPHYAIVMWNQYEDALPSGFNSSGTAFTAYWRNEY